MERDAFGNEKELERPPKAQRPLAARAGGAAVAIAAGMVLVPAAARVLGVSLGAPAAGAVVVACAVHVVVMVMRHADEDEAPPDDEARPSRLDFGSGARDAIPPERIPPPRV